MASTSQPPEDQSPLEGEVIASKVGEVEEDGSPKTSKKEQDGKKNLKAETNAEAEAKTSKVWAAASFLFSLPILKILQGIWLMATIRSLLFGGSNGMSSLLPFGGGGGTGNDNVNKVTPFYAEMRSDLYGDEHQFRQPGKEDSTGLIDLFFGPKPVEPTLPLNTGVPKNQRIVMTHLNREYESYRYSVQAAITSKVQASHEYAQKSLQRALVKTLSRIAHVQDVRSLTLLEERFLEDANRLLDKRDELKQSLVDVENFSFGGDQQCRNINASVRIMKNLPLSFITDDEETQCALMAGNVTDQTGNVTNQTLEEDLNTMSGRNATLLQIQVIDWHLASVTKTFVTQIKEALPNGPANAISDVLLGHTNQRGTPSLVEGLNTFPMRILLSDVQHQTQKRLFVLYFEGDLFASQVETLRKEVTAVLRSARPSSDEVLVVLQSTGGTVTGYGLVAAQLLRIKDAGFRLTVAVEQAAASGGYLAASIAPTIVCSPFAVVGSIGVIQEVPNIHKRLKDEGVEFHSITAGKYKRVLSATKKVSPDDLQKAKADLEEVHILFQDFVKEHRPSLDMDVVATGEVWFGSRAVEVGLCDAIKTVDSVLIDYVDNGFDVFHVKYQDQLEGFLDSFMREWKESTSAIYNNQGSITRAAIQWITQELFPLLKFEAKTNPVLMMA